jgi:hypothetical protein
VIPFWQRCERRVGRVANFLIKLCNASQRHAAFPQNDASDEPSYIAPVEYRPLNSHGLPSFMRCIASPARGLALKVGTYAPVVAVEGCGPNRNAIIVDGWGGALRLCERADGRWQLAADDGPVAEFLPA